MTRMAIIASLVSVASIDPALAQPLYCSVWQRHSRRRSIKPALSRRWQLASALNAA